MYMTRTPFRISFFGGGSDLPAFYRKHGGAVLSTTIDQYMYIMSHYYFDEGQIRLKGVQTQTVDRISDLHNPIAREVLSLIKCSGLEINSAADIPSGTGLGSSSAYAVGLLHNLYTRKDIQVTKHDLASTACKIEIDLLNHPIGKQDQYAVAYGGMNYIEFRPDDSVIVQPVGIDRDIREQLDSRLHLFYTGEQRDANGILAEQSKNSASHESTLCKMAQMARTGTKYLCARRLDDFGALLNEAWQLKRQLASQISNERIDALYARGLAAGALGGKLLGAGGNGFLLFYAPPEKTDALYAELSDLRPLRFAFESEGSKIVYEEPETNIRGRKHLPATGR
jgi:D-glycero-alpha-D-manno-heptose-7-phosphate kinase